MILEGAATGIVLTGLLAGQLRSSPRPLCDSDAAITAGDLTDSFSRVTVKMAGDTTLALGSSAETPDAVTRASLDALRGWSREAGEEPPSPAAITRAMRWVADLRSTIAPGSWQEPAVTGSESGEVVLEWRKLGRRITVYILEDAAEAIRSWGTSTKADMDVVVCHDADTLAGLLTWVAEAGDGTAGG